jgi:predicted dehydrogenase
MPDVETHSDYRAVLDDPDITSVFVATPTHLHRQIVIDALAAGKHVYCEAPLASTIEDAAAIARAAREARGQIFQSGLLHRFNPTYRSVFQFARSGALGRATMARAQWHKKESWRRPSPNREREREQNWRLDADISLGLIGEIGIQQIDAAMWLLGARPTSASGFGQIMLWDDGRTVPDTIQAMLGFPDGLHMIYDATLTSSFDRAYELFFGRDSTIMLRDSKAWMFKEVDAPQLGWEVYARKDTFYRETGIALVANATQLDAQNVDPAADDPDMETPLYYALRDFADNHAFGPYPSAAGIQEGLDATVVAIVANEAIRTGSRIDLDENASSRSDRRARLQSPIPSHLHTYNDSNHGYWITTLCRTTDARSRVSVHVRALLTTGCSDVEAEVAARPHPQIRTIGHRLGNALRRIEPRPVARLSAGRRPVRLADRRRHAGFRALEPRGGDLITREQYDDFELELEWRISEGGNSGIFYRVSEDAEYSRTYQTGPEFQVLDNDGHSDGVTEAHRAGANYALHAPSRDVTRPVGEWNTVRIVADSAHVEHWLNGEKIVEYEQWSDEWQRLVDESKFIDMPGYGQYHRGHIALQDHGDRVWYRNVRIRPLR